MKTKLTYLVSHPIQYQAPLLRRVASDLDIGFRVIFESIAPDHRYFDPGFEQSVKWDVDLTEGYDFAAASDVDLSDEIARSDVFWVHGWQTPLMRRALARAAGAGVPALMRGENCDLAMPDGPGVRGWLKRRYLARIFARCAGFLSIGTENRNYYLSRGVPSERIFDTPYAIDNDAFAEGARIAHAQRATFRDGLGIPPGRPVILFAGKFQKRKRPDLLVRAAALARWEGETPVLVFVGDGEMREELRAGAPEAVFTGFVNQSELPAYYDLADVFVMPSEREPWGLAVNEAMACGTPAVVSDQVGAAVDLVDGASGIVFPANDERALADALVECLRDADAMGRAAFEKVSGWNFDSDLAGLDAAIRHVTTANRG